MGGGESAAAVQSVSQTVSQSYNCYGHSAQGSVMYLTPVSVSACEEKSDGSTVEAVHRQHTVRKMMQTAPPRARPPVRTLCGCVIV